MLCNRVAVVAVGVWESVSGAVDYIVPSVDDVISNGGELRPPRRLFVLE